MKTVKLNTRRLVALGAAVVAIAGMAYWAGQVVAAGGIPKVPTTLKYVGTLEEQGKPVDGNRAITVSLWSHKTDTSLSNKVCQGGSSVVPVTNGHFEVELSDAACVTGVKQHADLWVQVTVENYTFTPREKLTAVPYAVKAEQADNFEVSGQLTVSSDAGTTALTATSATTGTANVTSLSAGSANVANKVTATSAEFSTVKATTFNVMNQIQAAGVKGAIFGGLWTSVTYGSSTIYPILNHITGKAQCPTGFSHYDVQHQYYTSSGWGHAHTYVCYK